MCMKMDDFLIITKSMPKVQRDRRDRINRAMSNKKETDWISTEDRISLWLDSFPTMKKNTLTPSSVALHPLPP